MPDDAIARHNHHAQDQPDPLRQLAQAFNQILDTPAPTAARPELGHLTVDQLDQRMTGAYDGIAASALRLADEHGVTGDDADRAVAEFLRRLRVRLEARLAEVYLTLRAQAA